ncbi:hypothetical protein MK079_02385 [Candidatus Gracilibacteria bacterium]|nr:hypothetical protein [Candidatus Gracilibacteria bacterium]
MQLVQVIIVENSQILDAFKNTFELAKVEQKDEYTLFEGKKVSQDKEMKYLFLFASDYKKALKYLGDHYDVFKVVIAGQASNLGNIDIKNTDVVIPNSFISTEGKGTFFLDYAIGESYDLEKFQVILNGICATGDIPKDEDENFYADISDESVFSILKAIEKQGFLKQTVVVKQVCESSDDSLDNLANITDFIVS